MDDRTNTLPFIDYIKSDKSSYPFASTIINPNTRKEYIDVDNDFLVGNSGGFLMNISFKFINTHIFSEVARIFEKNYKDPDIRKWVESLDVKSTSTKSQFLSKLVMPNPLSVLILFGWLILIVETLFFIIKKISSTSNGMWLNYFGEHLRGKKLILANTIRSFL